MMLIGGACLRLVVSGRYLDYVKDLMAVPLVISGIVLAALGLVGLLREALSAGSGHGEPRVAWLLLVPVLAVYLVPPPPLGADSIARDASRVTAPESTFGALPAGDPVELTVREFVERAVYDTSGELAQRRVRLTGFVVQAREREGGPAGTQAEGGPPVPWSLARVSVFCCAADGSAAVVDVTGLPGTEAGLAPDTWVEVIGTFVPFDQTPGPRSVPVIEVEELRIVESPANPYE